MQRTKTIKLSECKLFIIQNLSAKYQFRLNDCFQKLIYNQIKLRYQTSCQYIYWIFRLFLHIHQNALLLNFASQMFTISIYVSYSENGSLWFLIFTKSASMTSRLWKHFPFEIQQSISILRKNEFGLLFHDCCLLCLNIDSQK